MRITARERFLRHVEKSTTCWLWTGTKSHKGYGMFFLGGVKTQAHRAAWRLFRGPISPGRWVLHRCHVRDCVRPGHLYLGSARDNARDREDQYRKNGRLSPSRTFDHDWARAEVASGRTRADVARELGICRTTVSKVCAGAP
jgi:hypothetical protein